MNNDAQTTYFVWQSNFPLKSPAYFLNIYSFDHFSFLFSLK